MSDLEQDERWMRRALELARATEGLASPNPYVGCVLVRDGEIVGEGAHLYDQFDHAEIVALKQAGERARGATAYVTLEPCSHHGRTGPCAEALPLAGVKRVVAATVDPNPRVSGEGFAKLQATGIEVTFGVLESEARALNEAFARWVRSCRPLATLKAAVSADGMISPADKTRTKREPVWITGEAARARVQPMRHAADAVLTGIGTVLADDPLLTDRSGQPRRRTLLRVVLDSRLRMPLASKLVTSAAGDVLVFCGAEAEQSKMTALEAKRVEVVRVEGRDGRLDLNVVLGVLGERKILSVLLECGSELNAAFLSAGLVDRAVIFRSAKVIGADGVPFARGFGPPERLETAMKDLKRERFGEDECVSGALLDAWEGVG
ncbi:MAG TPA: bifunctional diaminohydroxyphosphoribosylaminopyrimidine deaminase/5-amino-6-(5-phosphoribosylamino)uracil reductase RibD [Acidobacteriaceae bacterium]|nr:bifunctional diaminohydroxyphosphoribosylaminopyrimidine deaminase/5-amino-6-(5-phosphoribosylamino)uracil reductase RibD [Acidobacteriaceae bacterium]